VRDYIKLLMHRLFHRNYMWAGGKEKECRRCGLRYRVWTQ